MRCLRHTHTLFLFNLSPQFSLSDSVGNTHVRCIPKSSRDFLKWKFIQFPKRDTRVNNEIWKSNYDCMLQMYLQLNRFVLYGSFLANVNKITIIHLIMHEFLNISVS